MMKLLTNQLFIGLIAGLALGYFFFHNCNKPKPCPEVVVKTDTVHVKDTNSTGWYIPEISFIESGKIPIGTTGFYKPKPAVVNIDTVAKTGFSSDFDFTKVDTSNERDLKALSTFNFYKDNVKTKYGTITIEDTLRENKIAARRVSTDFDIPVVTNTQTVTERKAHLFWNITAISDTKANINAGGGGLTFQFKDTRAMQVNYLYQFKKLYPGENNQQIQITLINPFSKH